MLTPIILVTGKMTVPLPVTVALTQYCLVALLRLPHGRHGGAAWAMASDGAKHGAHSVTRAITIPTPGSYATGDTCRAHCADTVSKGAV